MPIIVGSKFNNFGTGLLNGEFNFSTDEIGYALSIFEPQLAFDFLSDIIQIDYAFLTDDGPGGRVIPVANVFGNSTLTSVTLETIKLTAAGGTLPTWRYLTLYDKTHATDRLISFYDYGVNVVMFDGNEFILNSTGPIIQLTSVYKYG